MSESGAPRYIEGIESKNEWVTAIDIITVAIVNGDAMLSKNELKERSIMDIRFTCIPGIRPVIMPKDAPAKVAVISCKNM